LLIFGAICIGLFAWYQYHVYSTKKEVNKAVVEYLEHYGDSKDNIKEILYDVSVFKLYYTAEVVFKDAENLEYLFHYSQGDKGRMIKIGQVRGIGRGRIIPDDEKVKLQELRKSGWFYLDAKEMN
jgi:hypothetical protein